MNLIKIKCPAKINLDLKVFPKNQDGYHNILSVMQTINLFDFLTIEKSLGSKIILTGDSKEIPYDEKNICYKAIELFKKEINQEFECKINIKKNIPVCAGLAGGSTDAAGTLYGLNILSSNILSKEKLHKLAYKLGSDLNFCLEGSTKLCSKRGEELKKIDFQNFDLYLVKPKNLKISAKEAYCTFDNLKEKSNMKNDLEFALLKTGKYPDLKYLSSKNLQMSGSGPTFFKIGEQQPDFKINENEYLVIKNLNSIDYGVKEEL